jgi:hypothetical protein
MKARKLVMGLYLVGGAQFWEIFKNPDYDVHSNF